jgi:two-component system chemotaxis response regulator CheY
MAIKLDQVAFFGTIRYSKIIIKEKSKMDEVEKKIKALVVEDVHFIGLIIQRVIAPYGECDMAQTGMEAIDKFTQAFLYHNPYNLICLDILLPGMDGFEVLHSIRKFEDEINLSPESRVKVIMISTFNDQSTVRRARTAGCDRYIAKPFSMKKILEEIQSLGLIETEEEQTQQPPQQETTT